MAVTKSRRSEFLSYDDFHASVGEEIFAPVYLFIGKEDFLIEQCVELIVKALVPQETRGFNLDVVYGSKAEAKGVIAHASSFPMMGDRRVVVVKEFEKLVVGESAEEIVNNYVQHPLNSTCLVLVSAEPDFRKRPFLELKKVATIVSCDLLYDNEIPAWVSKRVREKGKTASIDACRLLQAYVGNSLRPLDNELDKLLIYTGDREELTTDDIAAVVGASKGFTVFDLQNCIGRKDMKEALTVLARMLEAGESPQMIIVMLTRFFTTFLRISELRQHRVPESQYSAELRMSPYFLKQYLVYHANFSSQHIEIAFRRLLAADTELKSSSADPHLVMDLLVYSLVRGTTEKELVSS